MRRISRPIQPPKILARNWEARLSINWPMSPRSAATTGLFQEIRQEFNVRLRESSEPYATTTGLSGGVGQSRGEDTRLHFHVQRSANANFKFPEYPSLEECRRAEGVRFARPAWRLGTPEATRNPGNSLGQKGGTDGVRVWGSLTTAPGAVVLLDHCKITGRRTEHNEPLRDRVRLRQKQQQVPNWSSQISHPEPISRVIRQWRSRSRAC